MWTCPRCGRTLPARNQTHTCASVGDIEAHFARSQASVREAYDAALNVVQGLGPVEVLAEKTRIAWHVRMSFAAFQPRVSWLDGHLVRAHDVPSPRWRRVEVFSARNVLHAFRLAGPEDVDDEFAGWPPEAYDVGAQRHRGR
jgi:Domain of unknown function (DUF5655)